MPDEQQKRYLYVAIDRAMHRVYLEIRRSQSAKDARAFMKQVEKKAPFQIQTVLTDNGNPFSDRLNKPGRPQTNGMVERFSGRISDVLTTRRLYQVRTWNRR